jgi:hypothetical protein
MSETEAVQYGFFAPHLFSPSVVSYIGARTMAERDVHVVAAHRRPLGADRRSCEFL